LYQNQHFIDWHHDWVLIKALYALVYLAVLSVIGAAVANILRRVLMKDDESDPVATAFIIGISVHVVQRPR
jgi:hypothetical protein